MWLPSDALLLLAQSNSHRAETGPDVVGLIGWAAVIIIVLVLIRQRRSKF